MTTIEKKSYLRQIRWAKSRRAESRGDFRKAFKIHQAILAVDQTSYAVFLRAGWLSYKLGAFEEAIQYYEQAAVICNDEGPKQGIRNCLAARRDAAASAKPALRSAAA